MTESRSFTAFQGSSLGINTAATNYLETEADMTKAVNEQIDDNIKMMNNHFDQLIKISNESHNANSKVIGELAQFTKQGKYIADWAIAKADAKKSLNRYYNKDEYQHRFKEEAETGEVEEELNQQEKINYTAAGKAENEFPELAHALATTDRSRVAQKEIFSQSIDQSEVFFERAAATLEVEVSPGVWKTWDDPGLTSEEREIISREIDEVFITSLQDQGFNKRLMDKYLLHPMLKKHKDRLSKAAAEEAAGLKEARKQDRANKFINDFKSAYDSQTENPGQVIENYLNNYQGYHSASSGLKDKGFVLAKQELQTVILDGLESGELDWEWIEESLQYEIKPHDGSKPKSIEDYLVNFARPIRIAVDKAKVDAANEADRERKNLIKDAENVYRDDWQSRGPNNPPSEEEVTAAWKDILQRYGEVSNDFKNYASKQDIADIDFVENLKIRLIKNGEQLKAEDLDGISDLDLKAEWLRKISLGGLTQAEVSARDTMVLSKLLNRLQEKDADSAVSNPSYEPIMTQAKQYYIEKYLAELGQGQSREDAVRIAHQDTEDKILAGYFDTRPRVSRDQTRADNLISARAAVIKDPSIVNSSDLLIGEEEPLKAALHMITYKKGNIPGYYRELTREMKITPYEFMINRLVSTGMLKNNDTESIPERELTPAGQDLLLYKPSPSRTNRALIETTLEENNEEKVAPLLELIGIDSIEGVLDVLRENAQRNNQLSGYEISQVNIDPALEEEHKQVVGEQSPYMRLNTMLPGVATAYVEQIYNV